MIMKLKAWHIHVFLGLLVISSFVVLYLANAVRSGSITYEYDFEDRSPFLSDFWPPERFDSTIPTIGGVVRPVVETPVTFFVHPTREFRNARVQMVFKFAQEAPLMLFYKSGIRDDDYKPFEIEQVEAMENGFWKATAAVDMNDWFRSNAGRYTAKIDSPLLLEHRNTLWVKHISVSLKD